MGKGYIYFMCARDTGTGSAINSCSLGDSKKIASWNTTRSDYPVSTNSVIYSLDNQTKNTSIVFNIVGMSCNYVILKCK